MPRAIALLSRLSTLAFALSLLGVAPGCDGGDSSSATAGAGGGGEGGTAGGGAGGTAGAGGAGGGDFVMQPHPAFPVIPGMKSAVIASPKLVTITFQDDPNASTVEAAGDHIGTSEWLAEIGPDYGVGKGTHIAKVVLQEDAPPALSEPDLIAKVDALILAGEIPAPTPDTIYMMYVAGQTVFDDGYGYYVCDDYLGYHWQLEATSGTLTYAIVGDCGRGIEEVTSTFAHEYIEAASDPGPEGGFYLQLSDTDPWYSQDGLENADLCDYAEYVVEDGFTYQRVWSNSRAAEAITSPCAPIDPDEVFYDVYAEPAMIPEVGAGESAMFTLTGWSAGPVADWELTYDAEYYGEFVPEVTLSETTINNGKTVTITLKVPSGTPGGLLGTAMIYSGDGYGRFWPVSVWSK
ncbi:MAG: hypothetical protein R3F14_09225 [Polyangiaceae bacterium]